MSVAASTQIPNYATQLKTAVRAAVQCAGPRLALATLRGIPSGPKKLGVWAELAACVLYGLAPWALLPKVVREKIHCGGSAVDHGVDAVGETGIYAQIKWYQPGSTIDNDAIAKLLHRRIR